MEVAVVSAKYNKIICYMIALFMIVSGICVDVDYVDSLFAYASSGCVTESVLSSIQDDYLSAETEAQEIRAIQESSNVYATIRSGSRRTDTKISIDLMIASLCLQNLFYFQKTAEAYEFQETLHQAVILSYIHEQDGMK